MIYKTVLALILLTLLSTPSVFAQGGIGEIDNELPLPAGGFVYSLDPEDIEAMQSARMTWIKKSIRLTAETDFEVIGELIEQSHQAGFNVLLTVIGSIPDLTTQGESYYPIFAEALTEIATLGPDAIEVWQEMNIARNWVAGQVDPVAYVDLLHMAYTAIRAVDPSIMVITGALAPFMGASMFGPDEVWNDDRYSQGLADAGAAEYADCIGVSYNSGATSPFVTSGDIRGDAPIWYFSPTIERAAAPFADADLPLCLTIMGYASTEGYPDATNFGLPAISIAQQAKWLRDAVLVAGNDDRFALLIVYSIDSPGDSISASWATIRADGTCPACRTIASLADIPNPEPVISVAPDEEAVVTLDASTPAAAFTIGPGSHEYIALRAAPAEGSEIDPILIVYDTSGTMLGFNDDADVTTSEALIQRLPGDQELRAVVYAFNEDILGEVFLSVNADISMAGRITGNSTVNIRSAPSTSASVVATIAPGSEVQISGRNADASWLAIRVGEVNGWVASFLVSVEGDVAGIPIVE